jgi:hypothetical protein
MISEQHQNNRSTAMGTASVISNGLGALLQMVFGMLI